MSCSFCFHWHRYDHHVPVTFIDCLLQERPVTSGGAEIGTGMGTKILLHPLTACFGRDWSHPVELTRVCGCGELVFGGHRASIDCAKLINEDHFVIGSQDG